MAIYLMLSGKGTRSLENKQLKDSLRLELEMRHGDVHRLDPEPLLLLRPRSSHVGSEAFGEIAVFSAFDFLSSERDGLGGPPLTSTPRFLRLFPSDSGAEMESFRLQFTKFK